jgi:hypothetical protein
MPLKTGWHIARVQDKIMNESRTAQSMWQQVLKTKVEWEGEGAEKKPKDPVKLKQLEDEFLSIEFDCGKWNKLNVHDIHMAKLTPIQMMALAPILDGLDDLEDKPALAVIEGGKDGDKKDS